MNHLKQYGVSERFIIEVTMYPEYRLARIIAQYRGKYKIVAECGETLAQISGKMQFDTEELAQYLAVGDFVMISQQEGDGEAIIHHILTRKSLFERKAVGISEQT